VCVCVCVSERIPHLRSYASNIQPHRPMRDLGGDRAEDAIGGLTRGQLCAQLDETVTMSGDALIFGSSRDGRWSRSV
jgi:hypothetical protein